MTRRTAKKIAAEPRLYTTDQLARASRRLHGGNDGTVERAGDLLMSNRYETKRAQRYERRIRRHWAGHHGRWDPNGRKVWLPTIPR